MSEADFTKALDKFAREGVTALASATPVESGLTSASWNYQIQRSKGSTTITWTNSHVVDGVPIAIILQYGHGTGTGGYVAGRDYINPAMKPIFDRIADSVWKVVKSV
jgi:hypothetical protein